MGIQERKQRERERRRQQIMIAAKRVFSVKGFSKTTMDDIAKEAELSPGTLYLYFKNKDELFSSLSIRVLQYLNIRLEHVINSSKPNSVEEKVGALKEAMYDVYKFDSMMLVNMFHLQSSDTVRNLSPQLLENIRELSHNSLGIMSQIFEEGIQAGIFFDMPPMTYADIIWSTFSGIVLWEESKRVFTHDKSYVEQALDTAFEIFRRGIKTTK
ncbi:TetR/AcrR family transcriptional regulator [Desulfonema ishimotonii]|uniref:TetR/AcrR family transcriptional regulator n=1 Tax=Desulfonema ishimotonii TaxID=45657 RepID=A0A401FV32_9BACT|nr:TetR/AcrR family transcriptional regulator [Desulfonema ishimotonii]GBC60826.1 TetR/AcrR family transcriptional regulator [Desulfonema ishimotonii]